MTTAGDMNTMVALAEAEVDLWLGGHADSDLTGLMAANLPLESQSIPIKVIFGLIGQLIDKVYDLEHP